LLARDRLPRRGGSFYMKDTRRNHSMPPFSLPRRSSPAGHRPAAHLLGLAAVVALVAGVASCSSTSAVDALVPVVGMFTLVNVDAAPLPYLDGSTYIVRGSLSIASDTHYQLTEVDSTSAGTSTLNSTGVWNITSNAIAFHDAGGTVYVGAADQTGDTVRVQVSTHLSVYVKQ
jgi:hypothetical protein